MNHHTAYESCAQYTGLQRGTGIPFNSGPCAVTCPPATAESPWLANNDRVVTECLLAALFAQLPTLYNPHQGPPLI